MKALVAQTFNVGFLIRAPEDSSEFEVMQAEVDLCHTHVRFFHIIPSPGLDWLWRVDFLKFPDWGLGLHSRLMA